jgi:hypothetical protein
MLRYIHRTPKSASGWSYPPSENMCSGPALVNNGDGTEVRFGSNADLTAPKSDFRSSPKRGSIASRNVEFVSRQSRLPVDQR